MSWLIGGNAAALYLHVVSFYGLVALGLPVWVAVATPCMALVALGGISAWRNGVEPKDIPAAIAGAIICGVLCPGSILPDIADEFPLMYYTPEWVDVFGLSCACIASFYLCTFLGMSGVLTTTVVAGVYLIQNALPISIEVWERSRLPEASPSEEGV